MPKDIFYLLDGDYKPGAYRVYLSGLIMGLLGLMYYTPRGLGLQVSG